MTVLPHRTDPAARRIRRENAITEQRRELHAADPTPVIPLSPGIVQAIADGLDQDVIDLPDGHISVLYVDTRGRGVKFISNAPRERRGCRHAVYVDGRCVLCSADEPSGGAS